jgi:hypothetical protein
MLAKIFVGGQKDAEEPRHASGQQNNSARKIPFEIKVLMKSVADSFHLAPALLMASCRTPMRREQVGFCPQFAADDRSGWSEECALVRPRQLTIKRKI